MTEQIIHRLNHSAAARWTVLFIVATAMMMGYFVNDVMSPLETLLEMPRSQGGLGWSQADYGFFSGAGGFFNVFLLMLFFSGLILDKMGIRFTGVLACSLMLIGTALKLYGVTADFGDATLSLFGAQLPLSVVVASLGFATFGVGYEMTGITVSKAMVRWFTGYELAMAMGIQLAMARLGTAAALSISAPLARHYSLPMPLLVSVAFLSLGLVAFLVFCVMDRKLDDAVANTPQTKAGDSQEDSDQFRLADIGITLRSPGFWLITLFCVLFYSAVSPFLKFSTRLMIVKYGVDADLAGFFSSIAPFGTILLTPLFGYVYDRYGRGATLVITGALMLTAVHFGFALPFHSASVAILLMVLLSLGYSLAPAALWPCVPKIIPLKCLGTAYSMIFFIQNFGRTIIPLVVSRTNEADPTYATSMIVFGCTALGAALAASGILWVDKRKGYGLQLPNIKYQ
jgi:MFS family permease